MNKFRLLAIAFVLGTASLFANNIVNPEISKDEIRKQIIELVQDSNTVLNSNAEEVRVTFTFSSEGEIVILKVNSTDKDVLLFVRENLNGKVLAKPGKVHKHYTMPIVIK
ncbi:hypothetical protein R3X25_03680 [Lutibacter sp. TH_r2]|uniref:hypothetical protein n=1 Tax=Lutibacter sp. TH_r2 TaxID=3082083 RepID=UPI0029534CFC|nr:hypothetical protein [Lutibacter sp. TH_r2]MDV7186371.1 hypothetical protein [Lutibacter sp. TH_r2]